MHAHHQYNTLKHIQLAATFIHLVRAGFNVGLYGLGDKIFNDLCTRCVWGARGQGGNGLHVT